MYIKYGYRMYVVHLTTGGDTDWLLEPLVPARWQADGHHHHCTLCCSHQQTGAYRAVCLPGISLAEVEGGDGLSRFSFYAGYT